jgi:hypothetical protein
MPEFRMSGHALELHETMDTDEPRRGTLRKRSHTSLSLKVKTGIPPVGMH